MKTSKMPSLLQRIACSAEIITHFSLLVYVTDMLMPASGYSTFYSQLLHFII